MKLIIFNRTPEVSITVRPGVWIAPDSAIVLPGRPLFLPDFSDNWKAFISPAVRISRLGKNISERFAPRYYDALSLIMRLEPVDMTREFLDKSEPGALSSSFDNCIQLGTWIPLTENSKPEDILIDTRYDRYQMTWNETEFDKSISTISKYMTLRNGDIMCPVTLPVSIEVKVGITIRANISGEECLSVRIK